MEISKTKLTLVIIGSVTVGMAVVIVVVSTWLYMQFQSNMPTNISFGGGRERLVSKAPDFTETKQYLGSQAVSFGENIDMENTVLATGDSILSGKASLKGRPLAGFKVRLRLNGKVASQWGTSDTDGVYRISVPAGRYTLTGFEVDREAANKVLAGMIMHPHQLGHFHETSNVVNATPGRAASSFDFEFTDPVVVLGPFGELPADGKVLITWRPYPNATSYRVQLTERMKMFQTGIVPQVFPWSSRPVVATNAFDISTTGAKLKADAQYQISVEALDVNGNVISQSADQFGMQPTFSVATAGK